MLNSQFAAARPIWRRQRGAALLVLLAIGALGAGAILIGMFRHSDPAARRERQTRQTLAEAREALLGFAMTQGRLPRPAISVTDGRENPAPCADERSCTGLLPWVTLGVSDIDGWSKHLRYSVTPAFTSAPLDPLLVVPDKVVLGRAPNGELSYVQGQPQCAVITPCLPVVLLSFGKRNFGLSTEGIAQANNGVGNDDEATNDSVSNRFIARAATADPAAAGGEFDDAVLWIPVKRLYTAMNSAGNLH